MLFPQITNDIRRLGRDLRVDSGRGKIAETVKEVLLEKGAVDEVEEEDVDVVVIGVDLVPHVAALQSGNSIATAGRIARMLII